MARGGKRQGAARTAYSNRTDLQMAPTEFEGQEYGQRAQQVASQQQVPIQRREPVIPQFTPLDAPTEFPERPVTYGLPSGPGAGPEALGFPAANASLEKLRPQLPVLERIADMPETSPETRAFIRRLRGALGA